MLVHPAARATPVALAIVRRMAPRRTLAALVTALALAVPATAAAQSAGDNQYQDPFGGNSGASATPTPSAPSTPSTPAPAPPAPAPAASSGTAAAPAQATAPAQSRSTLPYTGAPVAAGLLAALGAVLLATGLTLRLRLRERDGA
jgi:hypothetical protein